MKNELSQIFAELKEIQKAVKKNSNDLNNIPYQPLMNKILSAIRKVSSLYAKCNDVDNAELAMIAAVMSHNVFDSLYKHYEEGAMFCMDAISELAMQFEEKYRHVTEWSEYLDSIDYGGDWEEFVCDYAVHNRDNISSRKNKTVK